MSNNPTYHPTQSSLARLLADATGISYNTARQRVLRAIRAGEIQVITEPTPVIATEGIQAPEGWGGIIGNPALTLDDIHRAAVAHMDKAMPEKGHGYFHVMAGFVAGAMWALKMEEGNHEMKPPREQL